MFKYIYIVNSATFVWIWKLTKLFCFHTHLCPRHQAFHLFFLLQGKRQPFSPWRSIHGSLLHHDPLLSCVVHSLFLLTSPPAYTKNTNHPSAPVPGSHCHFSFILKELFALSSLHPLGCILTVNLRGCLHSHLQLQKMEWLCPLWNELLREACVSSSSPSLPFLLPFIFPPCVDSFQGSIFSPPSAYTYSPSLTDSSDFYNH